MKDLLMRILDREDALLDDDVELQLFEAVNRTSKLSFLTLSLSLSCSL